jgi:hypothetical protein
MSRTIHPLNPSPAPLLVAALALLNQGGPYRRARARLLLLRAASNDTLSTDERDICRELADELAA